jgi:hypothetical protein
MKEQEPAVSMCSTVRQGRHMWELQHRGRTSARISLSNARRYKSVMSKRVVSAMESALPTTGPRPSGALSFSNKLRKPQWAPPLRCERVATSPRCVQCSAFLASSCTAGDR